VNRNKTSLALTISGSDKTPFPATKKGRPREPFFK
jgi:hypothetical protein